MAMAFNYRLKRAAQYEGDNPQNSCQLSDYPKAHGNFGFRPTECFKMMMNGRGLEYFFTSESFAQKLYGHRTGLQDKHQADDRQQEYGIGQKSHHPQGCT